MKDERPSAFAFDENHLAAAPRSEDPEAAEGVQSVALRSS